MKYGIGLALIGLVAMSGAAHAQTTLPDASKIKTFSVEHLNTYQDKLQKQGDPFGAAAKMYQPQDNGYGKTIDNVSKGFSQNPPEYKNLYVPVGKNKYLTKPLFPHTMTGGHKAEK